MPGGADRGRLVIIWGPHEWTADFVGGELSERCGADRRVLNRASL